MYLHSSLVLMTPYRNFIFSQNRTHLLYRFFLWSPRHSSLQTYSHALMSSSFQSFSLAESSSESTWFFSFSMSLKYFFLSGETTSVLLFFFATGIFSFSELLLRFPNPSSDRAMSVSPFFVCLLLKIISFGTSITTNVGTLRTESNLIHSNKNMHEDWLHTEMWPKILKSDIYTQTRRHNCDKTFGHSMTEA